MRVNFSASPAIVLGEPGMGKTELIQELSRRLAVTPVTAVRFYSQQKSRVVRPVWEAVID